MTPWRVSANRRGPAVRGHRATRLLPPLVRPGRTWRCRSMFSGPLRQDQENVARLDASAEDDMDSGARGLRRRGCTSPRYRGFDQMDDAPSTRIRAVSATPAGQEVVSTRTEARIAAMPLPRKPKKAVSVGALSVSIDVTVRSTASGSSSAGIPRPSSSTLSVSAPPAPTYPCQVPSRLSAQRILDDLRSAPPPGTLRHLVDSGAPRGGR